MNLKSHNIHVQNKLIMYAVTDIFLDLNLSRLILALHKDLNLSRLILALHKDLNLSRLVFALQKDFGLVITFWYHVTFCYCVS